MDTGIVANVTASNPTRTRRTTLTAPGTVTLEEAVKYNHTAGVTVTFVASAPSPRTNGSAGAGILNHGEVTTTASPDTADQSSSTSVYTFSSSAAALSSAALVALSSTADGCPLQFQASAPVALRCQPRSNPQPVGGWWTWILADAAVLHYEMIAVAAASVVIPVLLLLLLACAEPVFVWIAALAPPVLLVAAAVALMIETHAISIVDGGEGGHVPSDSGVGEADNSMIAANATSTTFGTGGAAETSPPPSLPTLPATKEMFMALYICSYTLCVVAVVIAASDIAATFLSTLPQMHSTTLLDAIASSSPPHYPPPLRDGALPLFRSCRLGVERNVILC